MNQTGIQFNINVLGRALHLLSYYKRTTLSTAIIATCVISATSNRPQVHPAVNIARAPSDPLINDPDIWDGLKTGYAPTGAVWEPNVDVYKYAKHFQKGTQ